jgi:hypothetical protein
VDHHRHVVLAIFFPGGDIVLAVTAPSAQPAAARAAVLGSGVRSRRLRSPTWAGRRLVRRLRQRGVNLVTADTKVVDRGKGSDFPDHGNPGVRKCRLSIMLPAPARILVSAVGVASPSYQSAKAGFETVLEAIQRWSVLRALPAAGLTIRSMRDNPGRHPAPCRAGASAWA